MDPMDLHVYMADEDYDNLHSDFYYIIFEKLARKLSIWRLLNTMASDLQLFNVGLRFLSRVTILHLIRTEDGGHTTKFKVRDFSSKHGGTWYTSDERLMLTWLSSFSKISLMELDISCYPHEENDENMMEVSKMNLQSLETLKLNPQCSCSLCPKLVDQSRKLKSLVTPSGKTLTRLPTSLKLDLLSVTGRAIRAAFQEVRKSEGEDWYDVDVVRHIENYLVARLKVVELEITDAATIRLKSGFLMYVTERIGVTLLRFRSEVEFGRDFQEIDECDLGFAVVRGDRTGATNEYWNDEIEFSNLAEIVSIHPFPDRRSLLHLLRARRWFPRGLQLKFNGSRSIKDIETLLPELAQLLFMSRAGANVSIHVNTSDLLAELNSNHARSLRYNLTNILFNAGFYPVYIAMDRSQIALKFYNGEFDDPVQFIVHYLN